MSLADHLGSKKWERVRVMEVGGRRVTREELRAGQGGVWERGVPCPLTMQRKDIVWY